MADRTVSPGYLHLSRTIIVAKSTSSFNSDHTIRQYAHGLLLESQFLPSTPCLKKKWANLFFAITLSNLNRL